MQPYYEYNPKYDFDEKEGYQSPNYKAPAFIFSVKSFFLNSADSDWGNMRRFFF